MTEIWKDIPGYEGSYQVSDLGRVRSLDRVLNAHKLGRGYCRGVRGRILKPGASNVNSGHLTVALGRHNSQCVHFLVLLAFVGPRPAKMDTRHLDGNSANNILSNLEYCTRSRNGQDKKYHKGASTYKLTPSEVREIKTALLAPYYGLQADLCRKYNVSHSTIYNIKNNHVHRDVIV